MNQQVCMMLEMEEHGSERTRTLFGEVQVQAVVAGVELRFNGDGNDRSLWRIDWIGSCGDRGAMAVAMPSMIIRQIRFVSVD